VENDLTAYVDAKFLPGMIMMWYGSLLNMPPGWVLCDGNNGTPDLRNQFVVGAGSAYALAATGGSNTVALTQNELPVHAHGATTIVAAAAHAHPLTVNNSTSLLHNHPVTVNSADAVHTHTLTINSQNVNHVHSGTTSNQSANHTHAVGGTTATEGPHQHVFPGDDQLDGANGVAGWAATADGSFPYDARSVRGGGGRLWRTSAAGTHAHSFSGTTGGQSVNHNHFVTTGGMSTNESHAHTGSAAAAAATHVHTATTSSVDLTHNHTGTTDTVSASHNHIVTVDNAGGGAAFDVRPPYTALFYIMKT